MNSFRAILIAFVGAALAVTPALASKITRRTTSATHARSTAHKLAASSHRKSGKTAKGKKAAVSTHRLHGQQVIAPERVSQIQEALIREHYLTGAPSGEWNAETQAAMQKYQSDQGWQTKLMPDSRALKKLGLGPDYSGAINASGSGFSSPAPASTIPSGQAEGFTAASGVN